MYYPPINMSLPEVNAIMGRLGRIWHNTSGCWFEELGTIPAKKRFVAEYWYVDLGNQALAQWNPDDDGVVRTILVWIKEYGHYKHFHSIDEAVAQLKKTHGVFEVATGPETRAFLVLLLHPFFKHVDVGLLPLGGKSSTIISRFEDVETLSLAQSVFDKAMTPEVFIDFIVDNVSRGTPFNGKPLPNGAIRSESSPVPQCLVDLGLPAGATRQQIKKQFVEWILLHHPDCGGEAEVFTRISLAYKTALRLVTA